MLVVRVSTFSTRVGRFGFGHAQGGEHRGQHHTRTVAGLKEHRFVLFDDVGQGHGRHDADGVIGGLCVVGNFRLLDVEGERFLQAEPHHAFGFLAIRGQSFKVEQNHAHGGVRQQGNHIAGMGA